VLQDLVGREWDDVPDYPPSGCAQPTLQILFWYTGPSGSAKAVKYVAPSGARVFASGSLQFAWGLDNFATEEEGHAQPADPRLQQFMRNALADMTRPAPPSSLIPVISGSVVQVGMTEPDPRIRELTVYRHEGTGAFALSDGVKVCDGMPSAQCSEPVPPGHRTYVYAAVATDEWGQSVPLYSAPVAVPDSPPVVKVTGPHRARRGARVSFVAQASDRDGDTLAFHWRLDGRLLQSRASRVTVRVRRRGTHRLTLDVADGHGLGSRATARFSVR
jgi:hypothetical protein